MGKAALKAIAAIGAGGLSTAILWILTEALHVNLAAGMGPAIVALVTAGSAWVVGKAVAAQGPAAPSGPDSVRRPTSSGI
jgi:hypothetical protein